MANNVKSKRRFQPDTYMDLIRRFALKPIRNDHEHATAVGLAADLMGRDLDTGAGDYLDTLVLLVNKYEDEHHSPAGTEFGSPQEALRAIMDANGLSQADIGKVIGSESAVSMFLQGKRDLSKSHVKALMKRFRVDAGIFL